MNISDFQNRWTTLFANTATGTVDTVASFNEQFLQNFLKAHFKNNPKLYTIHLEREFNDHNTPRKFQLDLTVEKPGLQIILPPFPAGRDRSGVDRAFEDPTGWITFPGTTRMVRMHANAAPSPNVRVLAKVGIRLQWPKLGPAGGDWIFPEDGPLLLNCLVEAAIELRSLAADHEAPEVRQVLHLSVTQIKFDQSSVEGAGAASRKFLEGMRSLASPDEQKFKDLLIIAMNVAATQYAPQIVNNLPLPTPVVQKRKLYPAMLDLGEKMVTIGFSLDIPTYIQDATEAIDKASRHFEALLYEDLKKLGGIQAFTKLPAARRKNFRANFPRSTAFLIGVKGPPVRNKRGARAGAVVDQNLGVGIDEFLLHALASNALPKPNEGCTDWQTIIPELVRGRICHWVRLYGAEVAISKPANVQGSVHVDIGGAIEGCVRKFWDCSWSWDCGQLSLAVKGVPAVTLKLEQGSGIRFKAEIDGRLTLESNLPFPFDKVVEAFGDVVWFAIKGFIDIVLTQITFEIIPPDIELKDVNVTLKLSDFDPVYYERPNKWGPNDNYPPARLRFISIASLCKAR